MDGTILINSNTKIIEAKVFSLEGKLMQTNYSMNQIEVSHLKKGVYLLKITTTDKVLETKFVKE